MSKLASQLVGGNSLTTPVNDQFELEHLVARRMLNESDDWRFSTVIPVDHIEFKPDMRYPRDRHLTVDSCDVRVEWEVEIEQRSWGIKGIWCYVKNVEGSINLEGFEELPGEAEGQDVALTVTIDKTWKSEGRWDDYSTKNIADKSISPTRVDVDEMKKYIIVYFG